MLIVAKIKKILHPSVVIMLGVSLAWTKSSAHRVEADVDVEVKHGGHGGRWVGVNWGNRLVREKQGRQGRTREGEDSERGKYCGKPAPQERASAACDQQPCPHRTAPTPAAVVYPPRHSRHPRDQVCVCTSTPGLCAWHARASAQGPPCRANAGLDGPDAHQTRAHRQRSPHTAGHRRRENGIKGIGERKRGQGYTKQ
jgi:hypothetical protein